MAQAVVRAQAQAPEAARGWWRGLAVELAAVAALVEAVELASEAAERELAAVAAALVVAVELVAVAWQVPVAEPVVAAESKHLESG